MTEIWIDGPNTIFSNTLASLLSQHCFGAVVERPASPDVAVRDLQHLSPPYPFPEAPRTIAFVAGANEDLVRLIRVGYKGYLQPECEEDAVIRAVEAVLRGEIWGDRAVIAQAMERRDRRRLTSREQQVFELMCSGHTNRQIAHALGIRPNTVKVYSSSILHKLDVRNRTELILASRRP